MRVNLDGGFAWEGKAHVHRDTINSSVNMAYYGGGGACKSASPLPFYDACDLGGEDASRHYCIPKGFSTSVYFILAILPSHDSLFALPKHQPLISNISRPSLRPLSGY